MNTDEFFEAYKQMAKHVISFSEIGRREGLLALEGKLDQDKINKRDIFEYGMSFVIDGIDPDIIEKILSNIINQEKDDSLAALKTIQKEAVLAIQKGFNPRLLRCLINSFSCLSLDEDEIL